MAIKKTTGDMVFNPSPESTIELGDIVLAFREKKNLVDMEKIIDV